jgi:hypothetical protein
MTGTQSYQPSEYPFFGPIVRVIVMALKNKFYWDMIVLEFKF